MRVLVVVATEAEVGPFVAGLTRVAAAGPRVTRYRAPGHDIDLLISGVERFDVALNLGVCGSFTTAIAPGTVVHVVSDRLAELGA